MTEPNIIGVGGTCSTAQNLPADDNYCMALLTGEVCDGETCGSYGESPCVVYGTQKSSLFHSCLPNASYTVDKNTGRRIVYTSQVDPYRVAFGILVIWTVLYCVFLFVRYQMQPPVYVSHRYVSHHPSSR